MPGELQYLQISLILITRLTRVYACALHTRQPHWPQLCRTQQETPQEDWGKVSVPHVSDSVWNRISSVQMFYAIFKVF